MNIFSKAASRERLHLQRFNRDKVVITDKACTGLMEVVGATTGGPGVQSLQN